jgi:hypothetical protein
MPEPAWWVRADEPLVSHHVPNIDGDGAGESLCLTESLSWHLVMDDQARIRSCPLCAAVTRDSENVAPRWRVTSNRPGKPWGQPGDIRGR